MNKSRDFLPKKSLIIFKPNYLLKQLNGIVVLAAAFATFVAGFLLSSDKVYTISAKSLEYDLINSKVELGLFVGLVLLNYLIIRSSLIPVYAIKIQGELVSILFLVFLIVFSFTGFWIHLYLDYWISVTEITRDISQNPFPQFPLVIPSLLATTSNLTLFSVVIKTFGRYFSSVDYAALHYYLPRVIRVVEDLRIEHNKNLGNYVTSEVKFSNSIEKSIDSIDENIKLEANQYRNFLSNHLLKWLKDLDSFDKKYLKNDPDKLLELGVPEADLDPWKPYNLAYKTLKSITWYE